MRTTVDVDSHLLQRLRDEAHRRQIPLKEALNGALRRGLDQPANERSAYRCPAYAMGVPLRSLDKALALADSLADDEIARKLVLRK